MSSRRRHTRCREASCARRCVYETEFSLPPDWVQTTTRSNSNYHRPSCSRTRARILATTGLGSHYHALEFSLPPAWVLTTTRSNSHYHLPRFSLLRARILITTRLVSPYHALEITLPQLCLLPITRPNITFHTLFILHPR